MSFIRVDPEVVFQHFFGFVALVKLSHFLMDTDTEFEIEACSRLELNRYWDLQYSCQESAFNINDRDERI